MKITGNSIIGLFVVSVVAIASLGSLGSACPYPGNYPTAVVSSPIPTHTAPDRMASDSVAWLYADINVILSEQGMDLGSSAANSLDRSVHYNWAKVQKIQTLEDETARKIAIIARDENKFLDMYTQVSLELAHTGVFNGGGASMDSSVHYNWARDNVNYAKSTTGVRNALLDKVYTAYESV